MRGCGQRITGIFLRPRFVELAHITGMYTIVQIPSGEFLLEDQIDVDKSISSSLAHLSELQILSDVVADEVQFEVMVDGEEESIECLGEKTRCVCLGDRIGFASRCWLTDLIESSRCSADRNHIGVSLLLEENANLFSSTEERRKKRAGNVMFSQTLRHRL